MNHHLAFIRMFLLVISQSILLASECDAQAQKKPKTYCITYCRPKSPKKNDFIEESTQSEVYAHTSEERDRYISSPSECDAHDQRKANPNCVTYYPPGDRPKINEFNGASSQFEVYAHTSEEKDRYVSSPSECDAHDQKKAKHNCITYCPPGVGPKKNDLPGANFQYEVHAHTGDEKNRHVSSPSEYDVHDLQKANPNCITYYPSNVPQGINGFTETSSQSEVYAHTSEEKDRYVSSPSDCDQKRNPDIISLQEPLANRSMSLETPSNPRPMETERFSQFYQTCPIFPKVSFVKRGEMAHSVPEKRVDTIEPQQTVLEGQNSIENLANVAQDTIYTNAPHPQKFKIIHNPKTVAPDTTSSMITNDSMVRAPISSLSTGQNQSIENNVHFPFDLVSSDSQMNEMPSQRSSGSYLKGKILDVWKRSCTIRNALDRDHKIGSEHDNVVFGRSLCRDAPDPALVEFTSNHIMKNFGTDPQLRDEILKSLETAPHPLNLKAFEISPEYTEYLFDVFSSHNPSFAWTLEMKSGHLDSVGQNFTGKKSETKPICYEPDSQIFFGKKSKNCGIALTPTFPIRDNINAKSDVMKECMKDIMGDSPTVMLVNRESIDGQNDASVNAQKRSKNGCDNLFKFETQSYSSIKDRKSYSTCESTLAYNNCKGGEALRARYHEKLLTANKEIFNQNIDSQNNNNSVDDVSFEICDQKETPNTSKLSIENINETPDPKEITVEENGCVSPTLPTITEPLALPEAPNLQVLMPSLVFPPYRGSSYVTPVFQVLNNCLQLHKLLANEFNSDFPSMVALKNLFDFMSSSQFGNSNDYNIISRPTRSYLDEYQNLVAEFFEKSGIDFKKIRENTNPCMLMEDILLEILENAKKRRGQIYRSPFSHFVYSAEPYSFFLIHSGVCTFCSEMIYFKIRVKKNTIKETLDNYICKINDPKAKNQNNSCLPFFQKKKKVVLIAIFPELLIIKFDPLLKFSMKESEKSVSKFEKELVLENNEGMPERYILQSLLIKEKERASAIVKFENKWIHFVDSKRDEFSDLNLVALKQNLFACMAIYGRS